MSSQHHLPMDFHFLFKFQKEKKETLLCSSQYIFIENFWALLAPLKMKNKCVETKKITDGMNGITHRVKNIALLFLAFAFLEKIVSFR